MLTMLAVAFAVLAGATLLQAREAFVVGDRRGLWRWSIASLPLAAIAVTIAVLLLLRPSLLWWQPPTGFGPGWQCQDNTSPPVRICFRH